MPALRTYVTGFSLLELLEPCAGKLARTVLRGGKPVRAYLSRLQPFLASVGVMSAPHFADPQSAEPRYVSWPDIH
jgi:hypothetical protein